MAVRFWRGRDGVGKATGKLEENWRKILRKPWETQETRGEHPGKTTGKASENLRRHQGDFVGFREIDS